MVHAQEGELDLTRDKRDVALPPDYVDLLDLPDVQIRDTNGSDVLHDIIGQHWLKNGSWSASTCPCVVAVRNFVCKLFETSRARG